MRLWGFSRQFCYNIQECLRPKTKPLASGTSRGRKKMPVNKRGMLSPQKKDHAVREGPSYVKQRFKYCGWRASCGTVSALSGCKHLSRLINGAGKTCIMSEATFTCTRGAASSGAWSPDSRFRVYAQIFPCLKAQKDWLPISNFLWIRRIEFMRNLTTYSGGPDAQLRLYFIQNGFVKAGLCNLNRRLVKAELGRWGKVCMKAD